MIKDIDKYFPGTEFPDKFEEVFDELSESIHENAKKKGFWTSMEDVLLKMKYAEVQTSGHTVFDKREIKQVKKAFIAQKIMLIVSELGEAIESDRAGRYADWGRFERLYEEFRQDNHSNETCFVWAFEGTIKDTFEDEQADTVIRIFDLLEKLNIDLLKHIIYKMVYNTTRDKLHGKQY